MPGCRFRHLLVGAARVGAGLLALFFATSGSACAGSVPLANAESSPEGLALAVLDALERRNSEHLRELALSEEEFRGIVWPELPSAGPDPDLSFSSVWGNLRTRSEASLEATLQQYGGQDFVLLGLTFPQGMSEYRSYLVHRGSLLRVLDAGGRQHELRLFGSVLERGGQFKVFSYVLD